MIMLDLKRLYEIRELGEYILEITRVAEDNKTVLHSNAVTLNIVPWLFIVLTQISSMAA